MFLVTVILKSTPQILQFHFNELKTAKNAMRADNETDGVTLINDSYGSEAQILRAEIAGMFLTDLDREIEASEQVETAKLAAQMRSQRKAQEQAQSKIKAPFASAN